MRLVGRRFFPEFQLTCFTNTRIHAVGGVIFTIKMRQRLRRFVQMPNVMLCRILRAALAQQFQHLLFQRMGIDAFLHDVILMEDIAHEMTVIEFMHQLAVNFRRQMLIPFGVVTS